MTFKIVSTTDGRHIGEAIDPTATVLTFDDGGTMEVTKRLNSGDVCVLANSNYIIRAEKE